MSLTITMKERQPGVFTLYPVGSIDATTFSQLEKEMDMILEASPRVVVFDLAGVEYMSSMGVRVVLKAKKALATSGGKFALMNLQPQIKKVFDIIYALPDQEIFNSIEELDRYLDRMQRGEGGDH